MSAPPNCYAIEGPYRDVAYIVRRVRYGRQMAWAARGLRSFDVARRYARRLRTLDAHLMPERASWPIVQARPHAAYGTSYTVIDDGNGGPQ